MIKSPESAPASKRRGLLTQNVSPETVRSLINGKQTESVPLSDLSPKGLEIVSQETGRLNFLASIGMYKSIRIEDFPNLPPEFVVLKRFFARDAIVGPLIEARDRQTDKDKRKRINSRISVLMNEGIEELIQVIPEGPPAEEEYGKNPRLLSTEENQTLLAYIGLGLYDEITPDNFPPLRPMFKKSVDFIRLTALENKIRKLEEIATSSGMGYSVGKRDQEPVTVEIKRLTVIRNELVQKIFST